MGNIKIIFKTSYFWMFRNGMFDEFLNFWNFFFTFWTTKKLKLKQWIDQPWIFNSAVCKENWKNWFDRQKIPVFVFLLTQTKPAQHWPLKSRNLDYQKREFVNISLHQCKHFRKSVQVFYKTISPFRYLGCFFLENSLENMLSLSFLIFFLEQKNKYVNFTFTWSRLPVISAIIHDGQISARKRERNMIFE